MTRTALRTSALVGAITALAVTVGLGVWLISPSRFQTPSSPATAQSGPTGFNFTPLDKPRPLPELRFTNADGQDLSITDFRGRLVLLNLWATWCAPCRKEMPTLDRLEAKLGGPQFEVVALSIDRQGLSAVKPLYEELGLKILHIYLDQAGKAALELNAPGIPTTLLIDQEGRELGRVIGPAEWNGPEVEAVIRRYLNRKAAAVPDSTTFPSNLRVQFAHAGAPRYLPTMSRALTNFQP